SVNGDDGYPYGMPMNHWYNEEDGAIYFHSGKKGYRPEVLKKDNKVSYCVYDKGFKREGEWAWNVKSVIIFGKMELIEDLDVIADITRKLSYKFTDDTDYIEYEIRESSKNTLLMKLVPEHMCGKLVNEA
ncbi:MAG: pyridoxamine 5'-phosphate oxidase family protein, partial [Firmicutes bacterium]|nr:pyridoxamine 5'-phosphate oxidase family protein [Bacillota bacterium]